jgi:hypothetical protein
LVADVVEVVVVVESDIDGPDPFGAVEASATTPTMIKPATQLAAKILRIMITFHPGTAPRGGPCTLYTVSSTVRFCVTGSQNRRVQA